MSHKQTEEFLLHQAEVREEFENSLEDYPSAEENE